MSLALPAALFVTIPVGYILLRAAGAGPGDWARLLQTRIWLLLSNTLSLALVVTGGTLALGCALAWLTERSDLPGRKVFRWLFALPLAVPAYVAAIIHLALLRAHGGILPRLLASLFGRPTPTPSPLGLGGAGFIMILFTFPYVYLLSAGAFRSQHAALEEAARTLGCTSWAAFWRVTLPALRPSLLAGALLVSLDILAEYGTVAMLRYETFSSAIFIQLSGRYDRSAAAILSGVLVALALLLLWGELRLQGQARFTQLESAWRPAPRVRLGRWRVPALLFAGGVVFASLGVPLGMLTAWSAQAALDPAMRQAVFHTGGVSFAVFAANSLWTSALAALLAAIFALPPTLLAARYPGRLTRLIARFCQVGYAIPGVVIALSLVLLVNRAVPILYATPLVVVIAYMLRSMPQAVRATEAALGRVSPTLEEAARAAGRTPLQAFREVTLPLILPGMLAGAGLVFLTALKELPATLLLRPAGFDTLAVRVWMWSIDGFYIQAAPNALFIILASAPPLFFLLRREQIFQ